MRPNDDDFLFILIVAVGAWLAGRGVRARRRQAERLSELTARLGREREVNAALAVSEERLRVARELHDSVAGLLNVMVIQAAAAEAAPGQAADAVAAVQRAGREAASELARMLELLGGADGREPQPGLDRLDDLVAFARSAGVPVHLEVRGRRRLPAGLELSAYRIVQEALTNVVKHASGAATTVRLDFSTDALQIEVVDSGAGVAAIGVNGGHGLVNMRERVALFGGEVDSSPLHGGGFRVRARLPVA